MNKMSGKINVIPLIDPSTKKGKTFTRNVERVRNETFNNSEVKETTRLYKRLSEEQIKENPFLLTFLNSVKNTNDKELKTMLDCLQLKSITIGSFGRKAGYVHYPIEEPYFRFVLHLGSPEVYYIDSKKPVAMLDGYGFVITPKFSHETSFTIYNEPIRMIHDPVVQALIPKIRFKDYKRTILIYEYEYVPLEEVDDSLKVEGDSDGVLKVEDSLKADDLKVDVSIIDEKSKGDELEDSLKGEDSVVSESNLESSEIVETDGFQDDKEREAACSIC